MSTPTQANLPPAVKALAGTLLLSGGVTALLNTLGADRRDRKMRDEIQKERDFDDNALVLSVPGAKTAFDLAPTINAFTKDPRAGGAGMKETLPVLAAIIAGAYGGHRISSRAIDKRVVSRLREEEDRAQAEFLDTVSHKSAGSIWDGFTGTEKGFGIPASAGMIAAAFLTKRYLDAQERDGDEELEGDIPKLERIVVKNAGEDVKYAQDIVFVHMALQDTDPAIRTDEKLAQDLAAAGQTWDGLAKLASMPGVSMIQQFLQNAPDFRKSLQRAHMDKSPILKHFKWALNIPGIKQFADGRTYAQAEKSPFASLLGGLKSAEYVFGPSRQLGLSAIKTPEPQGLSISGFEAEPGAPVPVDPYEMGASKQLELGADTADVKVVPAEIPEELQGRLGVSDSTAAPAAPSTAAAPAPKARGGMGLGLAAGLGVGGLGAYLLWRRSQKKKEEARGKRAQFLQGPLDEQALKAITDAQSSAPKLKPKARTESARALLGQPSTSSGDLATDRMRQFDVSAAKDWLANQPAPGESGLRLQGALPEWRENAAADLIKKLSPIQSRAHAQAELDNFAGSSGSVFNDRTRDARVGRAEEWMAANPKPSNMGRNLLLGGLGAAGIYALMRRRKKKKKEKRANDLLIQRTPPSDKKSLLGSLGSTVAPYGATGLIAYILGRHHQNKSHDKKEYQRQRAEFEAYESRRSKYEKAPKGEKAANIPMAVLASFAGSSLADKEPGADGAANRAAPNQRVIRLSAEDGVDPAHIERLNGVLQQLVAEGEI